MSQTFEQITDKIQTCLQINSILGPCTQNIPQQFLQDGFDRAMEKIQRDAKFTPNPEFIRLVKRMRENPNEIQSYFEKINIKALMMNKKIEAICRSKLAPGEKQAKITLEQEESEQNRFQKLENMRRGERMRVRGGKLVSRKNHQIKK